MLLKDTIKNLILRGKNMIILTQTNYLNNAIDYYEKENGCSPYLFMNKETIKICGGYLNLSMSDSFLSHDGCRVFENNSLDFLEVELR